VVVDAGLGAPSHAAEAMEMGADAVLVNTALADAADHAAMAKAFALAVTAGFINRFTAMPSKLRQMEYLSWSKELTTNIENVGVAMFFAVMGAFTIWGIGTFCVRAKTLKVKS